MANLRGGKNFEKAIKSALTRMKPGLLKVGFLKGETYPDGTSLPMIAAGNEFGIPYRNIVSEDGVKSKVAIGQPPRPFFRNAIKKNQSDWAKASGKLFKKTGFDTEQTLALLGTIIADDVKQSIKDFKTPKLAPSTVKRKGFSKPLIDSSDMYDHVQSQVTMK